MAFRRIPHETRINAIKECIRIENTKEIALKYGVSEATIIRDCDDLLNEANCIFNAISKCKYSRNNNHPEKFQDLLPWNFKEPSILSRKDTG